MLNILLKSFDSSYCTPMLRAAFRGREIGTCLYVGDARDPAPPIEAERTVWMDAVALRAGHYPTADWNAVAPVDAALVEAMSPCEAVFLSMMDRYERSGAISYSERKRQYLTHLRFWNHLLDTEKVGLYLLNHVPHQCFDYVAYHLCKLKGIPTCHLERSYITDGVFLVRDFERSAEQLAPAMERLRREYADPGKEIPLSPSYEAFFEAQTRGRDYSWMTAPPAKRGSFALKWLGESLRLLRHQPLRFVRALASPDTWSRKLQQRGAARFYDRHVAQPDLAVRFVYVPLHLQPEASTSPMGGAFENQELIVQLLAALLPPHVRIYVKEHPVQGDRCRSVSFYRSMLELPAVRFVPRETDTYALSERAVAVATVTGTAGFEALFRGTPALLFGHRFYQYAPGVYPIRSEEDCRRAIAEIVAGKKPDLRALRLFLKACDECSVPYEGGLERPGAAPREERARLVGEMIRTALAPLFA